MVSSKKFSMQAEEDWSYENLIATTLLHYTDTDYISHD